MQKIFNIIFAIIYLFACTVIGYICVTLPLDIIIQYLLWIIVAFILILVYLLISEITYL